MQSPSDRPLHRDLRPHALLDVMSGTIRRGTTKPPFLDRDLLPSPSALRQSARRVFQKQEESVTRKERERISHEREFGSETKSSMDAVLKKIIYCLHLKQSLRSRRSRHTPILHMKNNQVGLNLFLQTYGKINK